MGAVGYVAKPFSPTELMARINALLRRRATAELTEPYVLGGHRAQLTLTEYGMLADLSAHPGQVVTHERLLERGCGA